MNERASCTGCLHRRGMVAATTVYSACHYLLDTGKPRNCPPTHCTRWEPSAKYTPQWLALLHRIAESEQEEE